MNACIIKEESSQDNNLSFDFKTLKREINSQQVNWKNIVKK